MKKIVVHLMLIVIFTILVSAEEVKILAVGEQYGGGIVIKISKNLNHGLILLEPNSKFKLQIPIDLNQIIGNQEKLSEVASEFFDWRLPSKSEIEYIFSIRNVIPNLGDDLYAFTRYNTQQVQVPTIRLAFLSFATGKEVSSSKGGFSVLFVRNF